MKKMIKILMVLFLITYANCIFTQIQANLKTGYSLSVMQETCVTINGSLKNDGIFNLASGSSGVSSLIIKEGLSGSGTYNVERYLAPEMWHLVSSPITNAKAGVFMNIWLRAYDEATNSFGAYITPPSTPMPSGQGFSVWTYSAENRTFSGKLNSGTISPPVQLSGGTPDPAKGWNLIGNPFTSAIDWESASGWGRNNIANAVYVWNQHQYATYLNGIASNGGSRYIAKSQGFFVQATNSSASVNMNNNIALHNPIPFRNNDEIQNLIRITVTGNDLTDETIVYLNSDASADYDYNFDEAKFYGSNEAPQLYTKKQNNMLSINALNSIENLAGKLIYLEVGEDNEYSLSFTHTLVEYSDVFIRDLVTNQYIQPEQQYEFVAQQLDNSARFEFVLGTTGIEKQLFTNISVWEYNNMLNVVVPADQHLESISVYNLLGSLVLKTNQTQSDLNSLAKGLYIVKVKTDKQAITEKIIIK